MSKTRPARSAVLAYHHAPGASARKSCRPRSTSCSRAGEPIIGDNLTKTGKGGEELLVSARLQSAFVLCVTASTYAAEPCCAALLKRMDLEAHVLNRPRWVCRIRQHDVIKDLGEERRIGLSVSMKGRTRRIPPHIVLAHALGQLKVASANRERCFGAFSSGNGCPTNVAISTPAGKFMVW